MTDKTRKGLEFKDETEGINPESSGTETELDTTKIAEEVASDIADEVDNLLGDDEFFEEDDDFEQSSDNTERAEAIQIIVASMKEIELYVANGNLEAALNLMDSINQLIAQHNLEVHDLGYGNLVELKFRLQKAVNTTVEKQAYAMSNVEGIMMQAISCVEQDIQMSLNGEDIVAILRNGFNYNTDNVDIFSPIVEKIFAMVANYALSKVKDLDPNKYSDQIDATVQFCLEGVQRGVFGLENLSSITRDELAELAGEGDLEIALAKTAIKIMQNKDVVPDYVLEQIKTLLDLGYTTYEELGTTEEEFGQLVMLSAGTDSFNS